MSLNVPLAFALAIFSGITHLDTYHEKRGESAGMPETANTHRTMSSCSALTFEVMT